MQFKDILYEVKGDYAHVTINRPKVYNAFRPETNTEMLDAFEICRERNDIDIVVITGIGDKACCSGGDQNVKGTC
jgi:naphthoate synthase